LSEVRIFVPELSALCEGDARVFEFRRGQRKLEGFVLRTEDAFVAYANVCPHWAVDLDMGCGRFWDERTRRIVCINHGALFHPATGLCETGPCLGESLERFTVELGSGGAWVTVPEAESV
jgi:nitrite reductase/ring-hydroxylating ferredoxin subunit